MRHRVLWLLVLAGALAAPVAIRAQATPDVPLEDPAYVDLDVLIAAGLVKNLMIGERPYSEKAFGRFVREANDAPPPAARRLREALDRLITRFGDGRNSVGPVTAPTVEASLASTQSRRMRGLGGDPHFLDATLDPLVQGNHGRIVDDGLAIAGEAGDAFRSRFLSAEASGRLSVAARGGKTVLQVPSASLRLAVGPAAIDLGRTPMQFGYGIDGGAFLSDNARALDGGRVRFADPIGFTRGPLRWLGRWQASQFLGTLGMNRDQPMSAVGVFRLGAAFPAHVEFGLNYLAVTGGFNIVKQPSLITRLAEMVLMSTRRFTNGYYSDKVAGADVRIGLPAIQSAITADFFTTDDRGHFSQPAHGYWEDAVWVVGGERRGFGDDGRWDARIEWRHAGPDTHGHYQWTSGITLDQRTIGDGLGPNASGWKARVAREAETTRITMTVAREDYFSSDWRVGPIPGRGPFDWAWTKLSEGTTEHRLRVTTEWASRASRAGWLPSATLGVERTTQFAFDPDRAGWGAIIRIGLRRAR